VNTTGFISTTIGRPDGHDCHLFMTIWRLHKHDWCHSHNHWEAAWQRLVSFFTTIGRPHGHECRHVFVYWEATATQLASYLRRLGGRINTTVVISMTTGRPSRYNLSHFYNHWGPHEHDWRHLFDHWEATWTRLVSFL